MTIFRKKKGEEGRSRSGGFYFFFSINFAIWSYIA